MMDTPELELSPKERVVATWNLQRHRDWGEIKRRLVIASGCIIGEVWRRILSKCISVPMCGLGS